MTAEYHKALRRLLDFLLAEHAQLGGDIRTVESVAERLNKRREEIAADVRRVAAVEERLDGRRVEVAEEVGAISRLLGLDPDKVVAGRARFSSWRSGARPQRSASPSVASSLEIHHLGGNRFKAVVDGRVLPLSGRLVQLLKILAADDDLPSSDPLVRFKSRDRLLLSLGGGEIPVSAGVLNNLLYRLRMSLVRHGFAPDLIQEYQAAPEKSLPGVDPQFADAGLEPRRGSGGLRFALISNCRKQSPPASASAS